MDTNKQSVSSQLAAMNAATAQVVTLTSGPQEDVDHTAVGTSPELADGAPERGVGEVGSVWCGVGTEGGGGGGVSGGGSVETGVNGAVKSSVGDADGDGDGDGDGDLAGGSDRVGMANCESGEVKSAVGGGVGAGARSSHSVPSSPVVSGRRSGPTRLFVTVTEELSPALGGRRIVSSPEPDGIPDEGRPHTDGDRHRVGTDVHQGVGTERGAVRGGRGGESAVRRPIRVCEETEYIEHIWPSSIARPPPLGRPPASPRRGGRSPVPGRRGWMRGWSEEPGAGRRRERAHAARACSEEGSAQAGRVNRACSEETSEVRTSRVHFSDGLVIEASGAHSEDLPASKTHHARPEESNSVRSNRAYSEETREAESNHVIFDHTDTPKTNHVAPDPTPRTELSRLYPTPRPRAERACSVGSQPLAPSPDAPGTSRPRSGSVDGASYSDWARSRVLARRVLQEAIQMQDERRRRPEDGGVGAGGTETGEKWEVRDGRESGDVWDVGKTREAGEVGEIKDDKDAESAGDASNAGNVDDNRDARSPRTALKTTQDSEYDESHTKDTEPAESDAVSDAAERSEDEGHAPKLHRPRSASEDLLWVEAEEAEELAWVESRLVMRFVDVEPTALRWRPGSGTGGEPLGLETKLVAAEVDTEAEEVGSTEEPVGAETEAEAEEAEAETEIGAKAEAEAAVGAEAAAEAGAVVEDGAEEVMSDPGSAAPAAVTAVRRSPLGPHGALLAVLVLCLAALLMLWLDRRLRERRTADAEPTELP